MRRARALPFLSFFRCNALCWDMWSKMKVITEFCYFFFKAWNVLPCVSPIISLSFQSSEPVTEGWWAFRVPVGPQCWVPLPWKIGSLFGPYFKDRPQWLKKRPRYLSRGTRDSIVMSAHVFLVFLGHLIFWIGMFKGFRSNGLEILIPKHMWKSIIGPLEQI